MFALANVGIELGSGVVGTALTGRLAWAVILGLVVGKSVGIAVFTAVGLRLDAGRLPEGVQFGHVVGGGVLAGVGFTVSLFVADLAFDSPGLVEQAKIGILVASAVAGVVGASMLLVMRRRAPG